MIGDGRVVTEFLSTMHRTFHKQLSDLRVHNDILYKVYENRRGRLMFQVVVPKHMITEVLAFAHDKRPSAHFGYRRMFARRKTLLAGNDRKVRSRVYEVQATMSR